MVDVCHCHRVCQCFIVGRYRTGFSLSLDDRVALSASRALSALLPGAGKIWIGQGSVAELRERGLHGVVKEAAQVFRTTMGAAHFDVPMPEQDEHLGPGGSVVIAMYTIAAAFHEFAIGLMSGRPSVLEPAILFGAVGLGLTCVLYL